MERMRDGGIWYELERGVGTEEHCGYPAAPWLWFRHRERGEPSLKKHNSQTGTVFLLIPPHSPHLPHSVTAALSFLHSSHTNLHPSFICLLLEHTNIVSNEKWAYVAKMVQTPCGIDVFEFSVFVCPTPIIASLKVSAALQSTAFNELWVMTTFRKT